MFWQRCKYLTCNTFNKLVILLRDNPNNHFLPMLLLHIYSHTRTHIQYMYEPVWMATPHRNMGIFMLHVQCMCRCGVCGRMCALCMCVHVCVCVRVCLAIHTCTTNAQYLVPFFRPKADTSETHDEINVGKVAERQTQMLVTGSKPAELKLHHC